ncbi:MAG: cytochrome c-type biogenesis protein CcmH [Gammaproteobacteria bacterium]|jgi:cytochrome c-type biogenesis protein CcmH
MKSLIAVLLLVLAWSVSAYAGEAQPVMGNQALQDRVMKLAGELRCLVCQGESLADSGSDFAQDMRVKIRGMVQDGKTDQQIKDYLVARYGDFILYRPPFSGITAYIWVAPFVVAVVGAALLIFNIKRRRQRMQVAPLSEEEQARVNNLLKEDTGDSKA